MKYLILCAMIVSSLHAYNDFELVIEPHWHNLESVKSTTEKFGGKWMLVGSLTFHKKAKEQVDLNRIYLRWKGPELDNLVGSLYRKDLDKQFIPLQKNLMCDGTWCKKQQVLKLTFDQTHSLRPTNTFYLVLTIPQEREAAIRKGHFEVVQQTLPQPYQATQNQLLLSLDALQATTVELP